MQVPQTKGIRCPYSLSFQIKVSSKWSLLNLFKILHFLTYPQLMVWLFQNSGMDVTLILFHPIFLYFSPSQASHTMKRLYFKPNYHYSMTLLPPSDFMASFSSFSILFCFWCFRIHILCFYWLLSIPHQIRYKPSNKLLFSFQFSSHRYSYIHCCFISYFSFYIKRKVTWQSKLYDPNCWNQTRKYWERLLNDEIS